VIMTRYKTAACNDYRCLSQSHHIGGTTMMKLIRRAVGVLFLAMVLVTPGAAQAQTTSNGPYYAKPAWDQILRCDTQATCPRFIVLSNWTATQPGPGPFPILITGVAVLDRETGLVWETSPSGSAFNWRNAEAHCSQLTVGNRWGWRLPTVQQLASLMDGDPANTSHPRLPTGPPFRNV